MRKQTGPQLARKIQAKMEQRWGTVSGETTSAAVTTLKRGLLLVQINTVVGGGVYSVEFSWGQSVLVLLGNLVCTAYLGLQF